MSINTDSVEWSLLVYKQSGWCQPVVRATSQARGEVLQIIIFALNLSF